MNEVHNVANYVGNEHSSIVADQVKNIGNQSIVTSYTQSCPEKSIDEKEKAQGGVPKTISVTGSTVASNVPGIEFLLHTDISNTMGSYESVQNYVQITDPAKHYQQLVDGKHTEKLSVSQSYQQLVNATLASEKLSEANYHSLNQMNANKVNEAVQRYQALSNANHKNISTQNYQQLRVNQNEKINESVHNHQTLINPSLTDSVQNYQHMNKLTRTTKSSNESVQNYQELGKHAQVNKSHESVTHYQQLDNSMQSNKLNKSQKFQQLNNQTTADKINESIQKLTQMSNANLGKPGDIIHRVQHVGNSIQTINEAVTTYQQLSSSDQKLNDSVQNYGALLEYSEKHSGSSQSFQQMENEGLTNACVKPSQNYQQLENSTSNVKKIESDQNYQQHSHSEQNERVNESVQNFQLVGNAAGQSNQSNIEQGDQTKEKSLVSIAHSNPAEVAVNTIDSSVISVSREHYVQRKPVGIREPIVIREQVTTANVPGIEYLLQNDMRNPSMINTTYIRNNEQLRGKQSNDNGSPNSNTEANTRRGYKNDPMVSNTLFTTQTNVAVVDRSGEIGSIISRDISVTRKPVGIREPIVMRESISSPPSVPGIEYMLHNEVSTESLSKKSRPPKEERPFLCTTCGNKFRQQSHLQQHIRIHTNHRPYQCSFCEKAFKQKSQLNQHERIHTGEKPYKCGICEKAFAQAGQLYSHRKTHGININEIKTPRESGEKATKKRGRRAKVEEMAASDVGSPPSVIYIMEPTHPRPPRPIHFQFPRPINDFRPHLFDNGERYPSEKLPKIETVVSMGPRTRMPVSSSPISTSSSNNNTQLCHWKIDSSKSLNSDT